MSDVESGDWELCYREGAHVSPTMNWDIRQCKNKSKHILVAAHYVDNTSAFSVLAAGRTRHALSQTVYPTSAYNENGAYWYNLPGMDRPICSHYD